MQASLICKKRQHTSNWQLGTLGSLTRPLRIWWHANYNLPLGKHFSQFLLNCVKWQYVHNEGGFSRFVLMKRPGLFTFRTASQGLSLLLQDELQCASPTDLQNGAIRNSPQQDDLTTVPSNFTATAKRQLQQNTVLKVTLWDTSVYPWKSTSVDAQF